MLPIALRPLPSSVVTSLTTSRACAYFSGSSAKDMPRR